MATDTTYGTEEMPLPQESLNEEPVAEEEDLSYETAVNEQFAQLNEFLSSNNIAEGLKEELLDTIGQRAVDDYMIDKKSREEWEQTYQKSMKLAKLVYQHKSFPWDGAANVMYPLVAQAAIQFAARAYPAIVSDNNIVKTRVIGKDDNGKKAARAMRVSEHMNYQLTEEIEYWEDDTDQMLHHLPITGLAYRKTYRNKTLNINESEFVSAEDLVVNYWAPSLERSRHTQIFQLYPNEIKEFIQIGAFQDFEHGHASHTGEESQDKKVDTQDMDAPHVFLEQHRWWDLDGDGYQEPYIVTVHLNTKKVVRITARFDVDGIHGDEKGNIHKIEAKCYYTKYSFIPSFDGSFYPIGFGALLECGSNVINSTTNQLLDAGTLSNTGGGFALSGVQFKGSRRGGDVLIAPGEFKSINAHTDDIRKAILPKPFNEPSQVLYQLLSFMVEANEKLVAMADIMVGQQPVANVPATTSMATIEQAMKLFTAIYKRIYRALKKEYKKLARLNSMYLTDEEYFNILDDEKAVSRIDYALGDCDIVPASNPNDVTDTMRLLAAQALLELKGQGLNDQEVNKRYLEALHIPDIDKLLEVEDTGPAPEVQLELAKLELESRKVEIDFFKTQAEVIKLKADAIKSIALAEAAEDGTQLDAYKAEIDALTAQMKASGGLANGSGKQGSVGRVEKRPDNTNVSGEAQPPQTGQGGQAE